MPKQSAMMTRIEAHYNALFHMKMGMLMQMGQDAAMIATGSEMLRWQAASTVFAGIVLLLTVLFQATGKVGPSFVLSISRQGVVFVASLLICTKLFAYNGVLMSQAVADVFSALIALGLLLYTNPMRQEM